MKKTFFAGFVFFCFVLLAYQQIASVFLIVFLGPLAMSTNYPVASIISLIVIYSVSFVIYLVYLHKLFKFKVNIIHWSNLIFGYLVVSSVLTTCISVFTLGENSSSLAIVGLYLVISYIIWRQFVKHLKKVFSNVPNQVS